VDLAADGLKSSVDGADAGKRSRPPTRRGEEVRNIPPHSASTLICVVGAMLISLVFSIVEVQDGR
jgi:hypothetical protein